MDFITTVNLLLIAGVIQGFGFNLVTLFVKKKFKKVIVFLNLIVLAITLNNLQAWLIDNDFVSSIFLIKHLQVPWYLFILPMFYAFTTHFLKIQDKVNDFLKFTLVIFAIEMVIRLCLISYAYYEVPDRDPSIIKTYTNIEEIFNLLYSMFLFVNSTLLIFRRHKLIAYILNFDDLNWVKWFIRIGSFVMLLWIVSVYVENIYHTDIARYPLRLGSSILLYWIGYQGFYKYNVVQDRIILRSSITANQVLITSNGKNGGSKNDLDFYNEKHLEEFKSIKKYIVKEKLYLNPLLSMDAITKDLGISKSHLSKLVNSYSHHNFSDFINSLRVEQAKKFLSNNEFNSYTIVAIGLECGFNSKSTFYSAFKKFTTITPTEYRGKN